MQMEWEYMGMSLGTETTEYLALNATWALKRLIIAVPNSLARTTLGIANSHWD